MNVKRIIAVGATLALLPLTAAADCENGPDGKPETKPRIDAGQAKPPKDDAGHGAQPAPVQGDPSAHNTQPGEVDLQVDWSSENKRTPSCLWRKNGAEQPCANMVEGHQLGGRGEYFGLWAHVDHGVAGDRYYLAAQGWPGTDTIQCTIMWKGHLFEGVTNGKRCSIELTLP